MPACDHCMLEVSDRDAVRDEIDGQAKVFCCHGCSGIYRLIHSEGLDDFYEKRREWVPGPSELQVVDVSAFQEGLRPAGAAIETDIVLDGIRCASCVWLNERILLRTPGIQFAQVNYATHRARVRWDPLTIDLDRILSRITSIGYTPKPYLPRAFEEDQRRQGRDLLIRFGTASFFSMQLMLFSFALYAGYFQGIDVRTRSFFHLISLALTTPVLFYSGWPIMQGAVRGLKNGAFSMDVLIAAGAVSAYGYSIVQMFTGGEVFFDTAAMIITLILLGRYIEVGAKRKASETIGRLLQLAPREARLLDLDSNAPLTAEALLRAKRRMVSLSAIRPGNLIEVVPGEKIAADGTVVSGSSEIDESMLTGESRPCGKRKESIVYGGTVNLYGSLIFEVTRTGTETVLAQIIRAVEDAQSRRAPVQAVADRVVGYFVPAVLVIAVLTLLGWLSLGASTAAAVMHAVSVLVIACPCALGLATPLAILIGTSHGASIGVLIKGGDVIQLTAAIDTVVLDKTGTVTEGRPVVNAFFGVGIPDHEALRIAASIERLSEHSLGKAIVEAGRGMDLLKIDAFTAVPGKGVKGMLTGLTVCAGSRAFITEEGGRIPSGEQLQPGLQERISNLERSGSTILYLSRESKLIGILSVADKTRPEAAEAVAILKQAGIGVSLVTGDMPSTALAVAAETGIGVVKAQVSPVQKAEEMARLKAEGSSVLMVGDGINDAPALVEATVGAAMGKATDIALESADIVILRPDLRLVPRTLELAKKTFQIIRQNLFWAFFYNIVVLPLAIAGLLHPIVAAGAMAFSSLTVVGNSLRARVR